MNYLVLGVLLSVSVILAIRGKSPLYFTASAVVGFAFVAGAAVTGPARFAIASALAIHLVVLAIGASVIRLAMATMIGLGLVVSVLIIESSAADAGERDTLFRLLILFPLAFTIGFLSRGGRSRPLLLAWIVWASISACGAILEYVLQTRFFDTAIIASTGDLAFRSGLGSEHPLVLASLLLVSTPLAHLLLSRPRDFYLYAALMVAGIFVTGARGPLVLLVLYLVLIALKLNARISARRLIPATLTGALLATIASGAFWRYTDPVITAVGGLSSELYRLVIAAVAWPSLLAAPWGWGVGGLPEGTYVVPSAYGFIDLARSIDSEYVLLAVNYGFFGCLISLVAIWLPWVFPSEGHLRWAAGLALICGFFLAIHSWAGYGSLILLLIGLTTANRLTESTTVPARAATPSAAGRASRVLPHWRTLRRVR